MKQTTAIIFLCVGLIWVAKGQQTERLILSSIKHAERPSKVAPQPDPSTLLQKMLRLDQTLSSRYPKARETENAPTRVILGTELLSDGGFESGYYGGPQIGTSGVTGPWSWNNSEYVLNPIWENYGSTVARTGRFMAYFHPIGPIESQLYQRVSIPSGSVATLSFWFKFSGAAGGDPTDVLGINFCDSGGEPISTFSKNYRPANSPGFSWNYYSYDVSALAGQTVYLLFWTKIKGSTVYQIDDISLSAAQAPAPTPTPTPGITPTATPTATPRITPTLTPTPTPTAPSSSNSKVIYSSGTAHAAGSNGAFWMTDMTFANGSSSDLRVKVFLNNATGDEQFGFVLPMGSSRTIVDVVQFFGLQDGSYVFRTEASCPVYAPACSVDQFGATARTYSQGYGGWFGTSLPSMASFTGVKTLAFQEISNSRKALYVFGMPTLAIAYDKNGQIISTLDLGIFSAGKLTRVPLGENVSHIRISVSPNSFCYGTQVDNATQSQVIIY